MGDVGLIPRHGAVQAARLGRFFKVCQEIQHFVSKLHSCPGVLQRFFVEYQSDGFKIVLVLCSHHTHLDFWSGRARARAGV